MVITVGSGGVPVGVYRARFARVEEYQSAGRPDLPPAYRWAWVVIGGPHDGAEASRITSRKFGAKAALPRLLRQIVGRETAPGEQLDVTSYYGAEGTIVVEETESGGTRVGSFLRDAPATPASADASVF